LGAPKEGGEREGESEKIELKTLKGKESDGRRENLREKEKKSLALLLSLAFSLSVAFSFQASADSELLVGVSLL